MKVDGTWVANDIERFGPDVPYGASVIPYRAMVDGSQVGPAVLR